MSGRAFPTLEVEGKSFESDQLKDRIDRDVELFSIDARDRKFGF